MPLSEDVPQTPLFRPDLTIKSLITLTVIIMYSPVKISMSSRLCLYAIEGRSVEKELLAEISKSSCEHWDVFEGSSIEREPLVETPMSSHVYLDTIEDGFVGKEPTTENPESSCWCWDVIICCSVDEETLTETSESTYLFIYNFFSNIMNLICLL